jgi:hypothetical protein
MKSKLPAAGCLPETCGCYLESGEGIEIGKTDPLLAEQIRDTGLKNAL